VVRCPVGGSTCVLGLQAWLLSQVDVETTRLAAAGFQLVIASVLVGGLAQLPDS
jgi:hypothetical protein